MGARSSSWSATRFAAGTRGRSPTGSKAQSGATFNISGSTGHLSAAASACCSTQSMQSEKGPPMKWIFAAATALTLTAPAVAQETVTVIHAGTLIAEPGRTPLRNASVVIRGKTIESVQSGFISMPGARVVDLRSATVMPGLIDAHVHLIGLDDRLQRRLLETTRDNEDEAYTG